MMFLTICRRLGLPEPTNPLLMVWGVCVSLHSQALERTPRLLPGQECHMLSLPPSLPLSPSGIQDGTQSLPHAVQVPYHSATSQPPVIWTQLMCVYFSSIKNRMIKLLYWILCRLHPRKLAWCEFPFLDLKAFVLFSLSPILTVKIQWISDECIYI